MFESISHLKRETQTALKRIGRVDLCLHEDELDFIAELISLLKPFKEITDLFSFSSPTSLVVPMMKARIRKICSASANDDKKIKLIKKAILDNLDCRFPLTDTVKLHQLLDLQTKDLLNRREATDILEKALKKAAERAFISNETAIHREKSKDSAGAKASDELPETKCKRLRMEMVYELRCEVPDISVTNKV